MHSRSSENTLHWSDSKDFLFQEIGKYSLNNLLIGPQNQISVFQLKKSTILLIFINIYENSTQAHYIPPP